MRKDKERYMSRDSHLNESVSQLDQVLKSVHLINIGVDGKDYMTVKLLGEVFE